MTLRQQCVRIDVMTIVWGKDSCVLDCVEMSEGRNSESECMKKEIESIKMALASQDRLCGMP